MLLLRPASWLALLSRTFTFELALAGSPRTSVEYDYVGKQSIPTTGLSPASPTALWAARPGPTPRSPPEVGFGSQLRGRSAVIVGTILLAGLLAIAPFVWGIEHLLGDIISRYFSSPA